MSILFSSHGHESTFQGKGADIFCVPMIDTNISSVKKEFTHKKCDSFVKI